MAAPSSSSSAYKLCPRCRLIYPARTNFCVRDREALVADGRIIAGRYILLNQIGSGTMSEVYAAEQPQLGRTVAIKILHRDPEVMRRFDREVRAVGQIRHDHVVTIHDSGSTEDGRLYLAMEFLPGEDLASLLKRHGPMNRLRAMLLWRQAVSAVAAAHRRQVIHRDIKPANLFVTYKEGDEGPEEIIKVIDFSIAKLANPGRELRPTDPGAIVGTVLYMAPEQLESGEATPRSDVYSLGLVLMEMLTGRLPWHAGVGDQEADGRALVSFLASPTPGSALKPEPPFSAELQQLAADVLSREPSRRPRDAGELLRRIKQLPEMRKGQRLPRRLSWPSLPVADSTPTELSPRAESAAPPSREVPPEVPPEVLAEATTDRSESVTTQTQSSVAAGENSAAADLAVEPPGPASGAGKQSWPLVSSGVPEVNDEWAEPTIPAAASRAENHMRALVATLLAESRRAYNETAAKAEDVTAATDKDSVAEINPMRPAFEQALAPGPAPGSAPGSALGSALEAIPGLALVQPKDDSNSNSSGNGVVWSAAELDRRLHAHDRGEAYPPAEKSEEEKDTAASANPFSPTDPAALMAPDVISEQPTVPTPIALPGAAAEIAREPIPERAPALAPVEHRDAAPLPDRALRPVPERATGARLFWSVLALGIVAGVFVLGVRRAQHPAKTPEVLSAAQRAASQDAEPAATIDLTMHEVARDLAAGSGGADLAAPDRVRAAALLGGTRDSAEADAGAGDAADALRVRFVYNAEDEVEDIDCAPAQVKRSGAQNKFTVRVTLGPGALCQIRSASGTRSYSYSQLARFRPDRSGEIRFHVRGGAATGSPAPPVAPARPAEPAQSPGEGGVVSP